MVVGDENGVAGRELALTIKGCENSSAASASEAPVSALSVSATVSASVGASNTASSAA